MLHGAICPVTATFSVMGIAAATYYASKSKDKPTAQRFAAITALLFALQMMNFPISGGTSGHLLGGVLAASLLGTPFGVLTISLVVSIQSLLFSDGGLSVLGANLFNMALLGAGLGGISRALLLKRGMHSSVATAVAAWASVVVAAFAVSVELAVDGQIAFATVAPAMLTTHALIGIGEAALTLLAVMLLASTENHSGKTQTVAPLSAAAVIALLLSPYASGLPDGLEWVAAQYRILHESAPPFVAPLHDYAVPFVSSEALATGLAGLLGVIASFAIAWLAMRMLARPTTA